VRSRDQIVEAGELARTGATHRPWLYSYKVKSGRRKTANIERMHYNITDLKGHAIERHARNSEPLAVYAIVRVMRSYLRSNREDI
jgi:hypothetical protein